MKTKTKKIPAAVRRYMEEFEQTEQETREYILSQVKMFNRLDTRGANVSEPQWIAFKMSLRTVTNGAEAIAWAQA